MWTALKTLQCDARHARLPPSRQKGDTMSTTKTPKMTRAKINKLIEMFCAGGEYELARDLARYADGCPSLLPTSVDA